MATFNCTNIKAAPAPEGASAYVTLSAAESLSIIPLLVLGQSCSITSSSKTGYVDFIDVYGHSFRIEPVSNNNSVESNTPGILKVNELITVTL